MQKISIDKTENHKTINSNSRSSLSKHRHNRCNINHKSNYAALFHAVGMRQKRHRYTLFLQLEIKCCKSEPPSSSALVFWRPCILKTCWNWQKYFERAQTRKKCCQRNNKNQVRFRREGHNVNMLLNTSFYSQLKWKVWMPSPSHHAQLKMTIFQ